MTIFEKEEKISSMTELDVSLMLKIVPLETLGKSTGNRSLYNNNYFSFSNLPKETCNYCKKKLAIP